MTPLSCRLRLRFAPVARTNMVTCALALALAGSARAQSWSPDGKQIAVGGPSLLLLDAQTAGATVPPAPSGLLRPGDPAPLVSVGAPIAPLPGAGISASPVWSRDSRTLAYLADGQKLTLFDMIKRQARVLDNNAFSPVVFSRDTSLLASVHKTEAGSLEARIRYLNGQTFLPPILLPFHGVPATFAPLAWITNTTNVIVAGGDGGKTDLYLLDQGDVVRLTSTGDVLGYAVSADGARLRWVRRAPNTHYILLQVYEMNIDKRSIVKLPYPDTLKAVNPNPHNAPDAVLSVVFAPDLSRFAFITRGGPQAGAGGTALWISDIAGQSVAFIGKGSVAPPDAASQGQATGLTFPYFAPAFSPDSKSLAALRSENGKRFLLVASALTGQGKATLLP